MAAHHSSLFSLSLTELDQLTINTAQLAITCHLFENHIHPRLLTPRHILAIKCNSLSHFASRRSLRMLVDGTYVNDDPEILIRQAVAYGQYRNCLRAPQFGDMDARQLFFNHLLTVTPGITLFRFSDSVNNWFFIDRLQREGASAQKEVLEKGWAAYMLVPEQLKRDVGLLDEE